MTRQWKRGTLTIAALIMLASPQLFAQNARGNRPQQGRPAQGAPMQQGRSDNMRYNNQANNMRQRGGQQRGTFGIYAEEWQALSSEDQAKLHNFITEIGLDNRPDHRAMVAFMSQEERLAHSLTPRSTKRARHLSG